MVALLRVLAIASEKGEVTIDRCSGGICKRKQLQWRIVRPWRLANDPLLLAPNDLSGENG